MKGIIKGIDGRAPDFAGGPLGLIRLLLWELGASVLVATGLMVVFASFVWERGYYWMHRKIRATGHGGIPTPEQAAQPLPATHPLVHWKSGMTHGG